MIMIIISLIFTAVPLDFSPALNEKLPITIGAIIFILFGEVIIYVKKLRRERKKMAKRIVGSTLNKMALECRRI